MSYHIVILDRIGYWVEVHGVLTDTSMLDINSWVVENKLGKRMAYNIWKLKSDVARNLFILRWS